MIIRKINNNEVEVIRTKVVPVVANGRATQTQVEVADESTKISYGRLKLTDEINAIQAQIDIWSDPRRVEEHIESLRNKLDELREIERELNS